MESGSNTTPFTQADFDDDEINVLDYLVHHRCMTPETGKREEAIERDLGPKMNNLADVLRRLVKKQAIGNTKKGKGGKTHYYASSHVLSVLKELGRWSPGRLHRL